MGMNSLKPRKDEPPLVEADLHERALRVLARIIARVHVSEPEPHEDGKGDEREKRR